MGEIRECGFLDLPLHMAESRLPSFKKALKDMNNTYTRGSKEACVFLEVTESGVQSTCKVLKQGPCLKNNGEVLASQETQASCESLQGEIKTQMRSCSK